MKVLKLSTLIELIWTITPAIILILIAFPSFKLLYLMDEVNDPSMSILAEGFSLGGLKLFILCILFKIKDASYVGTNSHLTGEKNNTYVSSNWLAQVKDTSYSLYYKSHKLTSLVGVYTPSHKRAFHTKIRASSRIGPHDQDILSVVIGSLLGDGYANARTIEGTRISYRQSEVHKDYLFWLYEFYSLRGYVSPNGVQSKVSKFNPNLVLYSFETLTFRSFNWISDMFLKDGKSFLSFKVEEYLTPLALGIWAISKGRMLNGELLLGTGLQKFEDIDRLKFILVNLYGFKCYIFKDTAYGIQLEPNSLYTFLSITAPLFSSMQTIKKAQSFNNLLNHPRHNSIISRQLVNSGLRSKYLGFGEKSLFRLYSTSAYNNITVNPLNPNFVTGFCDCESTFYLGITKSSTARSGWLISVSFSIEVYDKDKELLEAVKSFFSVGNIRVRGRDNQLIYSVSSVKDIKNIIIPHFINYPLFTQKWSDFELFKSAIDIIDSKEHLIEEGLHKLIAIKASMNKGLSQLLSSEFSVKPCPRPSVKLPDVLDYNWIAGFVEAEGCFYAEINKSKSTRTGKSVGLGFKIGLHSRDNPVLLKLHEQLCCGGVREDLKYNSSTFLVRNTADIFTNIIPIFEKYPLFGVKRLNYLDFCQIAILIKNKEHLTKKGLNTIEKIKDGMNTKRG